MKIRSGLIAAVFLAGGAALSASTLANTQVGVSNLSFHVETGLVDLTTFVIDTGGDLFNYDPTTGEAHFAVAALPEVIDGQAVYDEPFFCFEGGNPSVGLSATDANGYVIAENIHAGGNLEYLPTAKSIILSPASSSYCFYKNKLGSELGPLGLFGVPPQNEEDEQDPEELFSDSFEAGDPRLEVQYIRNTGSGYQEFTYLEASGGHTVEYFLHVKNVSNADATALAVQEVFPANPDVYGVVLDEGTWRCNSHSNCPDSSWKTGPVRIEGLNLPANQTITFQIQREVVADSIGTIHLHAAAVDTNSSGNDDETASYDTAEAYIHVESGSSIGLQFNSQPDSGAIFMPGEPVEPSIVVALVDAQGNVVGSDNSTWIRLDLFTTSIGPGITSFPVTDFATVCEQVYAGEASFGFSAGGPYLPETLSPGQYYFEADVAEESGSECDMQSGGWGSVNSNKFQVGAL